MEIIKVLLFGCAFMSLENFVSGQYHLLLAKHMIEGEYRFKSDFRQYSYTERFSLADCFIKMLKILFINDIDSVASPI